MKELAVVTVVVAFALVFAAAYIVLVDCGSDDVCTRGGEVQFSVALVGLAPAIGMLLASVLGRFRPGVWFCATALVWAFWVVLVWRL